MKVHILDADVDKYRGLYYTNNDRVTEFNRRFNGTPMKSSWRIVKDFAFVPADLPKGDTPGLSSHIPVFNMKAARILADYLESSGEFLPIICDGEKYFLFNATRVVDALDEKNSRLKLFHDGRIMYIDRYFFSKDKLAGTVVFKLPQKPLGWVYVTDPFVERVRRAKLTGFKFPLVWSSE
jgi:hypothetical protein